MKRRPVVLMVLDGFGLSDTKEYNAIAMAKTPVIDKLSALMLRALHPASQSDSLTDRWVTQRLAT